jgi:hypothetical protein
MSIDEDTGINLDQLRCPNGHTDWGIGPLGLIHCSQCEKRGQRCKHEYVQDPISGSRVSPEQLDESLKSHR